MDDLVPSFSPFYSLFLEVFFCPVLFPSFYTVFFFMSFPLLSSRWFLFSSLYVVCFFYCL
jgi:hypothetical protein